MIYGKRKEEEEGLRTNFRRPRGAKWDFVGVGVGVEGATLFGCVSLPVSFDFFWEGGRLTCQFPPSCDFLLLFPFGTDFLLSSVDFDFFFILLLCQRR